MANKFKPGLRQGNSKTGASIMTLTFSRRSCRLTAPCNGACGGCYFRRNVEWRAGEFAENNLRAWEDDPESFEAAVKADLDRVRPAFVRLFVGGDCPDRRFAEFTVALAAAYPGTNFLAFTKKSYSAWSTRPANLAIVASEWPGMPSVFDPDIHDGRSWITFHGPKGRMWTATHEECVDDYHSFVPDASIPCLGDCESCGMCWRIRQAGGNVTFEFH